MSSSPAHVSEQTLSRLIGEFAALGGTGIRFTGGEPLCHPDWLELVRLARSYGFAHIFLQTNAMLFTDEQVAALRELDFPGLSIQVSLDGATAATHDLVRGKEAFDWAMAGIQQLVAGGLARRITVFCTEMRHNLAEIPPLLELADVMGIGSVVTGTLIQGGRAAGDPLVAPPGRDQYLRLLDCYDADAGFRELYERIGKVAALEWRTSAPQRTDCCTFVENPYLTPDGRLYPCVLCHADDFAVSRLFEKSLVEAFTEGVPRWSSLRQISQSRAGAIRECRECSGRLTCAGGCMGRALGSCGDLMAADDRCAMRKTIYRLFGRRGKIPHCGQNT
jgi:radical SAM protein with 4Fe4S-binding SPASM domain